MSGILPICQDDDGLATVLGHEIAHNVAHHVGEQLSRWSLLVPIAWIAAIVLDISGNLPMQVLDLIVSRPGSRTQEVSLA